MAFCVLARVLIDIAKQGEDHRPVGVERKGKLRIEQRDVDALLVSHGGGKREQGFAGTGSRRCDEGQRLLSLLGTLQGGLNQRIVVAAR